MKVTDYSFGRIVVDGKLYTGDIKIIKGKVIPNWWRKEGHLLQLDDIKDILDASPKILVVGTGSAGVMRIHPHVERYLRDLGIDLEAARSSKAVKLFNDLLDKMGPEQVSLAIHLTC